MRLFVLIVLIFIPAVMKAQQQPIAVDKYFDAQNLIRFADFLYQQGDYIRAAGEYQRALITFDDREAYLNGQIGRCLIKSGEPQRATEYLQHAVHKTSGFAQDSLRLALGSAFFLSQRNSDALSQIDSLPELPLYQQPKILFAALDHLQQKNWDSALQQLQRPGVPDDPVIADLRRLAIAGQHIRQKSPALAATMSAIIPGSGKWYANRKSDGLYSLFLIAGSSWLAWEGFDDEGSSSVKGWIFGSAGALFYAGNIYGSAVAVRLFNQDQIRKVENDVAARLEILLRY